MRVANVVSYMYDDYLLINSYLAFLLFDMTTLLQLGVYGEKPFMRLRLSKLFPKVNVLQN